MTIEELNNCCLFNVNNCIRIVSKEASHCTVEVLLTDSVLNPYGTAHGGIIFSACDTAACVAGYDGKILPVTQTAFLNFVRPGIGSKVIVDAECRYNGTHSIVSHVDVFSADHSTLLATGDFTMVKNSHIQIAAQRKEDSHA